MKAQRLSDQKYHWLSMLVILAGVVLRLKVYLDNRSLFIDEAALACEILSKPFADLFAPLHYQFAPPLYAVVVKISTQFFGTNEYTLRLVSLLAGILTLFLFYKLIRKQSADLGQIFSLGLLSFGIPFLQYSSECKQYGIDVLATTFLLWLFFKYKDKTKPTSFFITASLIGVVIIWSSMPSVFILAGLGLYFLLVNISKNRIAEVWKFLAVIATWLISFGIYYFTILKNDASIGSLVSYHQEYFFPLLPNSGSELTRGANLLLNVLKKGIGATAIALIPGLLLLVLGIYRYWKKDRLLCAALLIPFLLTIITSGLGLYSMIGRMLLFLMPLLFLLLAKGMDYFQERLTGYWSLIIWAYILLVWINLNGYKFYFQPYQIEELRPVLEYVHERQEPDATAFVHFVGINTFRFYQEFHQDRSKFQVTAARLTDWKDPMQSLVKKQPLPCWVIATHLPEEEQENFLQLFAQRGKVVDSFQSKNAGAWLFLAKD